MTNEERLAMATRYLDMMLDSLRADLADGEGVSADEFARMATVLKYDGETEWIDMLMWVLAIAQARLVGWSTL